MLPSQFNAGFTIRFLCRYFGLVIVTAVLASNVGLKYILDFVLIDDRFIDIHGTVL